MKIRTIADIIAVLAVVLYVAFALVWDNILRPAIGELEGAIDPVSRDFQLSSVTGSEAGTDVYGSFEILRAHECEFVAIDWRISTPQRELGVTTTWDTATLRVNGRNYFGPWHVAMNENDLLHNSVAEVIHQCYWIVRWGHDQEGVPYPVRRYAKPWLTITHIYP